MIWELSNPHPKPWSVQDHTNTDTIIQFENAAFPDIASANPNDATWPGAQESKLAVLSGKEGWHAYSLSPVR